MHIIQLPDAWSSLPENPSLAEGEIHLWMASLLQPSTYLNTLTAFLSSDELTKAQQFYFEKDRFASIAARGMLRKILGHYRSLPPQKIQFQYSSHGKPFLVYDTDLEFNVSHSHERVLYAITRKRAVGVDIEYLRPVQELQQLAQHYFSKNEIAMLETVPPEKRLEAFYNCWTRKEAYIKAKGEGLSMPLHLFDVSLIPGEPARLLQTRGDEQEAHRWILEAFTPEKNYIAALVVESTLKYS